jgi:hypothetical protein
MPDSPDILMRYVLTGVVWGQVTETTLWLRSKPTADTSDMLAYLTAIVSDFEVFLLPSIKAVASVDWQITQAQIEVLAGSLEYQVIQNYTNVYGQRSPDSLPTHDAQLLSLYTEFHGRRTHGRLYFPAIPEDQQIGGRLGDAQLDRLQTIGTLMVSRYGLVSNNAFCWICVFSRKNGVQRVAGPPPRLAYDPLAALPITRTVAQRNIATQRHRKIGRGI